jgi:virginiamycin B lyase
VGLHHSRHIGVATAALGIWVCSSGFTSTLADAVALPPLRSISELTPAATIHVGKTADWVAVTADAVWVGSTGPYAVHRIDPKTNRLTASVALPGEPCAGLATGFGSLWVPMCTGVPSLAKVDLAGNRLTAVFAVGPAAAEGGVATGAGDVWLIVDKVGTLARIDPATGSIRQTVKVPAGSYNPYFSDGQIWVTRADGAELTRVDAASGAVFDTVLTGPNPRFLTAAAGAIWTLNQGDGTLTRVDARTRQATTTVTLGTPGHGGDISYGDGMVWTTMPKVPLSAVDAEARKLRCQWGGPGGDSLGIGHGAIWLTDYHAGTISRIALKDALAHCSLPSRSPQTPRLPPGNH